MHVVQYFSLRGCPRNNKSKYRGGGLARCVSLVIGRTIWSALVVCWLLCCCCCVVLLCTSRTIRACLVGRHHSRTHARVKKKSSAWVSQPGHEKSGELMRRHGAFAAPCVCRRRWSVRPARTCAQRNSRPPFVWALM